MRSNFSSFPQYFLPVVRFLCLGRTRFSLRDKWLFEISEFEEGGGGGSGEGSGAYSAIFKPLRPSSKKVKAANFSKIPPKIYTGECGP